MFQSLLLVTIYATLREGRSILLILMALVSAPEGSHASFQTFDVSPTDILLGIMLQQDLVLLQIPSKTRVIILGSYISRVLISSAIFTY